jgi:hypothetical protein
MFFNGKTRDEDFEEYELPNKKIMLVHLNDDLSYNTHFEIEY